MTQEENKTLLIGILNGNIEYCPIKKDKTTTIKKQKRNRQDEIVNYYENNKEECTLAKIAENTNNELNTVIKH